MEQRELRKHFVESVRDTLENVVSPTPYFAIREAKDQVGVRFLDGRGGLPTPETTEVTVLDLDTAALFFDDFRLLYEGQTGTGKTFSTDALFHTVYGPNGHYTVRLGGGLLGKSPLEPFTTTTLENGVPKTRIDQEKCGKYGALFIDEINRGDADEVFQVIDGVIHVNGDTGYLRIPIPNTEPTRYKSLAIIAAMNPADAQHSGTVELDIAGENRFLKFKFPNGACEAGSGQLRKRKDLEKIAEELHETFWNKFRERTDTQGDWRTLYPVVTDPTQVSSGLDGATEELIDVSLGYVGQDPKETYERNAELLKQADIEPTFTIPTGNDYKKVRESQETLKHGFVRRDLEKIGNLSRLIAFIKSTKDGTYDPDVTLNDVTASTGLVLESKTVTGTIPGSLMSVANDARAQYVALRDSLSVPEGYGIRQAILHSALHAGSEHGFAGYSNTLQQGINSLNAQIQGRNIADATIRSRLLADLVVLDHFSKSHEGDVTTAVSEKDINAALDAFSQIYQEHKKEASVYEHRLSTIIE